MSAVGGVVAGVLALTFLDATLEGSQAPGGGPVAGAATLAASILRRVLDPAVPLIPDLRATASEQPAVYHQPPANVYLPPAHTGQAAPPANAQTLIPA